ncbi:TonB-dependent receptor plug domain-containing protein [Roseateles saccharophilus]|uniref:TonB-dependent receptor plug domain-containing protein n=1 Tax=Roseateles saccharophilus TaxID=304 RepID=UPI0014055186|nr:TonB-dependent receptor [Roseateles saccharophilus]MDG0834440.1 TonB-dependent receptor [Roseateles saccharophilus]
MTSRPFAPAWYATLALSFAAQAAPGPDASDDKALEALLKREVQGPSRYAQSLMDAPASVSVLEREESDALGHQTVGDQLARLPGVYLSNSRTYSALGLRGFSRPGDYNSRVLMAIDGQRVNEAIFDQGLPQLEFPVVAEWVQRVELVRGPGSSVYGSNALLGVVNVVTLDGADAPGLSTQGSVGEHGLRRVEMHYGAADAGDRDLFVGLNLQDSAGENLYLPELGTPDGWVRRLDGEQQAALLVKYRDGPWRLSLNAVRRDKDAATAPYGTEPGVAGTRYSDREVLTELAYDAGWQDDVRSSVRLNVAGYEFRGRYVFGPPPERINRDEAYAQWTTLEGRVLWRGVLNHQLMAGAELRTAPIGVQRNYDVSPYNDILNTRSSQDSAALYAQDQWRLAPTLQLTTGLRLDRVRGFSPALSPRAVLALRPDERESFKLMWAQSFRTPNLYERFYDDGGATQIGNAALKPERLNSAEASWEHLLRNGLALSANAYWTQMSRLIEQVPLSDSPDAVVQYRNVGRVRLRGVDLDIEQRAGGGWLWRGSASWMDARNQSGERLSNAPTWMLKGHLVSPQWRGWQLGVEGNVLGPRLGRVEVPTSVVVNAHLRYRVDARQSVSLHLNNALDRHNLDPSTPDTALSAIPQLARAWRLDWRISL